MNSDLLLKTTNLIWVATEIVLTFPHSSPQMLRASLGLGFSVWVRPGSCGDSAHPPSGELLGTSLIFFFKVYEHKKLSSGELHSLPTPKQAKLSSTHRATHVYLKATAGARCGGTLLSSQHSGGWSRITIVNQSGLNSETLFIKTNKKVEAAFILQSYLSSEWQGSSPWSLWIITQSIRRKLYFWFWPWFYKRIKYISWWND